ncbi:universal stress protein [Salinirubrum litoreum]|uniref:Universal stress protein n=1 Tax=Salinirubrum litoreum TaxID=1126234 RepID=A0ABD5REV3_9EURY|nr:universal stress protein [Salinirubrum litoreum]
MDTPDSTDSAETVGTADTPDSADTLGTAGTPDSTDTLGTAGTPDAVDAGPVLVAVSDPAHVEQLVRTAGDLARLGSGLVRIVTVAVKPHDSPFGVFDDETIRREFADDSHELLASATTPAGVGVDRQVVVARSVAGGIVSAVDQWDPSALVVGWTGATSRRDAVFGTTVDRLVERVSCDLYVERIGREADGVESVLLPVAGGPHVGVSARVAVAIADRNDARVVCYTVATPTGDRDTEAVLAEAQAAVDALGRDVPVSRVVRESPDVTDAVVADADDYDVLVFGATRQGPLRRRLAGSVPRSVVARTDQTLLVARDGDTVGGLWHRLGELIRR